MEAALALAHEQETQPAGVVVARDLSRRYGAGETAVDALRDVSLAIPRGHLTAVMGPSGSGFSPAIERGRRMFSSAESIGRRLKNWKTKPM